MNMSVIALSSYCVQAKSIRPILRPFLDTVSSSLPLGCYAVLWGGMFKFLSSQTQQSYSYEQTLTLVVARVGTSLR